MKIWEYVETDRLVPEQLASFYISYGINHAVISH